MKEFNRQLEILSTNTLEIIPYEEFKLMLKKSIDENRPLRVKCGIDPTVSTVHLGHLVVYRKMRQFQDLGHKGVVIIGDYTAQIGDPSGKNETRPKLTGEEVMENAKHYMDQLYSVLDKDNTEVHYQSEWFSKVTLQEVLGWAQETTVAKLFSHETFKNRLNDGQALGLHEFFYPVLQGLDSVFIKADVELGGSDQKFNVLMGRDYQKNRQMIPQVSMLLPLLTGLCGKQKMSKSLNNFIGTLDEPFDKFGKIMSIPDNLMIEYFKYLLFVPPQEISEIEKGLKDNSLHPNQTKKDLAQRVVSFFHGEDCANKMREQFEKVFAQKKVPEEIPEYKFDQKINIVDILVDSKLCSSKGEVRRLIKQNGISIVDGEKIDDPNLLLDDSYKGKVVRIGKRKFLKLG